MNNLVTGGLSNDDSQNKVEKVCSGIIRWLPLISVGMRVLVMLAFGAFPALAQNPWGGNAGTKITNAGSNTLVALTWFSVFVGLVAAVSIGICIYFEKDYKKNIAVALFGFGLGGVFGSLAYDIVNLDSISISAPTIGN